MEKEANNFRDGAEKERILKWVKWARDKADWIDPFIEKEDELLGESISLIHEILKSNDLK